MRLQESQIGTMEWLRQPAAFAVVFFLLGSFLLVAAAGTAWLVIALAPVSAVGRVTYVMCFGLSSGLLAAGSVQLVRASAFVQLERQRQFRRCLAWAVGCGTAFVCVQACGLWSLLVPQTSDFATGVRHAAFAFILLHAVHVIVALLIVTYIFLRALTDRYDHEYSWGVTFCGWFWHGLGIVWIAIMGVFTVAGAAAMAH